MHAGTQIIETVRLTLRPFILQDAGSMHKNWISDSEVQWNYGEPAYEDLGSVKELLEKWIASYVRSEFYRWAIILKDNEECIGQIAFCSVDEQHHFADIEYAIGKSYQNQGYASEALAAVIQFTFKQTGLNRLQAFHRGRNVPSAKVLQKAQMRYEGTLRQSYYYSETDEYDDRVYYGITKKDFF
ncbi:GNAT family N-acetyltransferase [Paenibacillus zanthoxyli]|uniref:GNAT family N-acetyltransferase n=1 Tax=Paenibacillus zanthoxyli TaxID=369399 RepID=UPI0004711754|nr:GNAT family N-acetyltransferase [Paenibacillus zanthoxyli]